MTRHGNELRDTPGRLMLLWAVFVVPLIIFAWRVHLAPDDYGWAEYPTALGDKGYYQTMIGGNDFLEPNLKFTGQEKGLFRRQFNPETRDDAAMWKIEKESTGRFFVYSDSDAAPRPAKGKTPPKRYFLKTGENAFVEFGARKYYPSDPLGPPVPRAVPLTAPPQ